MLRYKIASWLGLFTALASFTTARAAEADYKQMLMSFMFSLMGLAMNYRAQPDASRGFGGMFGQLLGGL